MSMMIIEPDNQRQLSVAVENLSSEQVLDLMLEGRNPEEQVVFMRDSIRGLGQISKAIGQAILSMLWRINREGLWAIPLESHVTYISFREWVEEEVAPYVVGKDFTQEYLQDMVRVIERQFTYLLVNPVYDPASGERITPEMMMQKSNAKKLKETSSAFLDVKPTPERNELIGDILNLSSKQVKEKWIQGRQKDTLKIGYQEELGHVSGTMTVVFPNLDPDRYELLMTLGAGVFEKQ